MARKSTFDEIRNKMGANVREYADELGLEMTMRSARTNSLDNPTRFLITYALAPTKTQAKSPKGNSFLIKLRRAGPEDRAEYELYEQRGCKEKLLDHGGMLLRTNLSKLVVRSFPEWFKEKTVARGTRSSGAKRITIFY